MSTARSPRPSGTGPAAPDYWDLRKARPPQGGDRGLRAQVPRGRLHPPLSRAQRPRPVLGRARRLGSHRARPPRGPQAPLRAGGGSPRLLREANPELRYGVTPPGSGYALKVPAAGAAAVRAVVDDPSRKLLRYYLHTVRSGDTLSGIARRYGTPMPAIRRLQSGLKPDRITAGPGHRRARAQGRAAPRAGSGRGDAPDFSSSYIVAKGDTLWSISLRYEVQPELLAERNGLEPRQRDPRRYGAPRADTESDAMKNKSIADDSRAAALAACALPCARGRESLRRPADGDAARPTRRARASTGRRASSASTSSSTSAAAGLRLPEGRLEAERMVEHDLPALAKDAVFALQADSYRTIEDAVADGSLETEALVALAGPRPARALLLLEGHEKIPRDLHPEPRRRGLALPHGAQPSPIRAPLEARPTRAYTGIVDLRQGKPPRARRGRRGQAPALPLPEGLRFAR